VRAKLKPKRHNNLQQRSKNTPRQNPINPERQTFCPKTPLASSAKLESTG
jgi:hypothetical protein